MAESLSAQKPRAFLGVERSALGRPWRDRLDVGGQARALAIAQLVGAGDLLSRVLAGRGVTPETAEAHLDPTLRRLLPDPNALKDMEAAAERIADAIERSDKIAIFGDYDVDGAASSALLADYFSSCGAPCVIHIPDRIFEGYGPNVEAIRNLAEAGAKLLITVDCGTMSHAPLAEARRLGLDPIVLDHHQAPEILPEAIIVNPNRQDDLSGQGQLCAAGVAFMTLIALNRALRQRGFFSSTRQAPDLLAGLDLVALATIADVAPLTGLNRAFVAKGLAVMRARGRVGLTALFDVAGADGPPKPYHLGFLIGPRINAGGRIGDAALGARLLSLADPVEARRIAEELDRLNRERQELERATLEDAEAQALASLGLDDIGAAVVAAADGWHPGVVGLVASRLKDKFRRPAFAIAFLDAGGVGTGSGRSIPGVDLGRVVRAAVEAGILVKGGGHAMAAGITICRERVADFQAFLEEKLAAPVAAGRAGEALLIDAALTAAAATPALMAALERAGPYGAGNAEPIFVLPAHRLVDVADVGNGHVRLRAQAGDGARIDGIAFRAGAEPLGRALHAGRGAMMHLAGTLALDRWGGRDRVQLRLLDLAPAAGPRSA
ncbi:single-stranded-DNA-specific exonuclease RecJ [Methylocapsa aurea]|uniref:single-stranded-DNA-specific exonuclease RecJ n=1 Tax=Methylocapsa aurea TaxID=663610 RepID=UPI00055BAC12|nr:single-stranded-DNA-specific exonuclease RecJ [Methylocapsa aurea]